MIRTSSCERTLFISATLPLRITITVSSEPVVSSVVRNPSAMESTVTITATTPATPTTAVSEAPRRW